MLTKKMRLQGFLPKFDIFFLLSPIPSADLDGKGGPLMTSWAPVHLGSPIWPHMNRQGIAMS